MGLGQLSPPLSNLFWFISYALTTLEIFDFLMHNFSDKIVKFSHILTQGPRAKASHEVNA